MSNKQFFKKAKGPMDNYEDWYSYRTENEEIVITHEWCYVSPSLVKNNGSKEFALDDFYQSGEVHEAAKAALRDTLKSL